MVSYRYTTVWSSAYLWYTCVYTAVHSRAAKHYIVLLYYSIHQLIDVANIYTQHSRYDHSHSTQNASKEEVELPTPFYLLLGGLAPILRILAPALRYDIFIQLYNNGNDTLIV